MTNEELVRLAKMGDCDALAKLWEQNRGLVAKLFRELMAKAGARMAAMGVTWEDVEQSFFLVIDLAVRLYEPDRGTLFSSFLVYPVKTVFFDMIGWRTEQQKHDPLGQSLSLDEPLSSEDGDGVRGDFVQDPNDAYADADERLYHMQLQAVMDDCLVTLDQQQERVVRYHYYDGLTLEEVGSIMGCNAADAWKLESRGLRKLRSPQNVSKLMPYRDQIINESAYHGTGWNAWKNGDSVQERIVSRLEDKGLL